MAYAEFERRWDLQDDDAEPVPRGTPGRVPVTARLAPRPTTNIVFRVADATTASALGQALSPRDPNGVAGDADLAVAAASSASGRPLPSRVRERFEASLGSDLGGVRIHTDAASAAAARAVGAKAYTVGQDIHFAEGTYDHEDAFGLHLLAHEVAHTVQQRGRTPAQQNKLEVSAPVDAAEVEADRAADAMVTGAPFVVATLGNTLSRKKDPKKEADDAKISDEKKAELRTALGQATAVEAVGGASASMFDTVDTAIGALLDMMYQRCQASSLAYEAAFKSHEAVLAEASKSPKANAAEEFVWGLVGKAFLVVIPEAAGVVAAYSTMEGAISKVGSFLKVAKAAGVPTPELPKSEAQKPGDSSVADPTAHLRRLFEAYHAFSSRARAHTKAGARVLVAKAGATQLADAINAHLQDAEPRNSEFTVEACLAAAKAMPEILSTANAAVCAYQTLGLGLISKLSTMPAADAHQIEHAMWIEYMSGNSNWTHPAIILRLRMLGVVGRGSTLDIDPLVVPGVALDHVDNQKEVQGRADGAFDMLKLTGEEGESQEGSVLVNGSYLPAVGPDGCPVPPGTKIRVVGVTGGDGGTVLKVVPVEHERGGYCEDAPASEGTSSGGEASSG